MKGQSSEIVIPTLDSETIVVTIKGKTPLIMNRMSAKARHTLLLGGKKKTTADRQMVKHDPYAEFYASMHLDRGCNEHSHIKFPCVAFKAAMATAALVTPGTKKTDVQRLVFIPDEYVPIYGVPRLRMDIVRSSDVARTPDVRTRAMFFPWATQFKLQFITPALNKATIITMLNNGGLVCGVGENRQEKGKGNFGTFEVVQDLDESLLDLKGQEDALETVVVADDETKELLDEYHAELGRRS